MTRFGLNFTDALKEKAKGFNTRYSEYADEDKKLLAASMLGNRNNALIDDPSKYFGDAETYSRFIGGLPSHKRTSYTDQQAINEYLLGRDSNRMDLASLLMSQERPEPEFAKQQLGSLAAPQFDNFYDAYYEDPGQFQYLLNNTR